LFAPGIGRAFGFGVRGLRFVVHTGELLAHTLAGSHQKKSENNHVAGSSR
jgi:hypothetical protein